MVIALKLISLFQAEFGDSKQVFTAVATNKSDAKALVSYFILSKCTDIRIDLSQTIPHTTHQFSVDQSSVHQVQAIPQLPSSVTVAQDTPGYIPPTTAVSIDAKSSFYLCPIKVKMMGLNFILKCGRINQ